jgi:hypothetical protein
MGLPKIDQPIFTLTLPSSGEKIKFRPFTVKEEKVLLIAQESKDADHIVDSIKQIINNCILTDIDISQFALFDLEYVLMQIRAQSVNNNVKFTIQDPEFEEPIQLEFNIDNLKLQYPEGHSKEITVNETTKIVMRYPTMDQLTQMISAVKAEATEADMMGVMLNCIDSVIVDEDQVYRLSDYSEDEVISFIEDMSVLTVNQIKEFFETMPRLRHEVEYEVHGKQKKFVIEGTETFFI